MKVIGMKHNPNNETAFQTESWIGSSAQIDAYM